MEGRYGFVGIIILLIKIYLLQVIDTKVNQLQLPGAFHCLFMHSFYKDSFYLSILRVYVLYLWSEFITLLENLLNVFVKVKNSFPLSSLPLSPGISNWI